MLTLVPRRIQTPPPCWPPLYVLGVAGEVIALHHNDYEGSRPPALGGLARIFAGEDEA